MSENFKSSVLAIRDHLSYQPPQNGIHVYSGFAKCLLEAREISGRDSNTGALVDDSKRGSWVGTIGYMALLDQIGTCFKPNNSVDIEGNSIKKALGYFTSLSQDEINALYSLRCAFAHDFSLYNTNNRTGMTHYFKVGVLPDEPVVTLPTTPWDGNFNSNKNTCSTLISLHSFTQLVEDICIKLFDLSNKNELQVVLDGGSDELLQRYSIIEFTK